MKLITVKTGNLIIDEKLTALRRINPMIVSKYQQAYRSGASMPPLIINAETYEVISGNHRLSALLKEYGDDHKIKVEPREYGNNLEILRDFAAENVNHGYAFTSYDRNKLIMEMVKEKATIQEIAQIFNISVKRIEEIGEQTVMVSIGGKQTEPKPVKRGFTSEKPISEHQYKEHKNKDIGVPILQQANQLTRWLENGYIKPTDTNIIAIQKLENAIQKYLEGIPMAVEK